MEMTVTELSNIWKKALKKIESTGEVDKITYDTFFPSSKLISLDGGKATILTNSAVAQNILSNKYSSLIDEILKEVTQTEYELVFTTESNQSEVRGSKPSSTQAYFSDSKLDPSFTFDNFVVGASNREAYQAALFAAKKPGEFFNPVLIYGDSGLGKTHLLHAIGNHIKETKPSLNVLYIKAHDFLEEYVKYIKGDKDGVGIVDWFKNNVDVLLVDDVQFLASKEKTEETFFSIYSHLYSSGKQIVITSDKHPSTLRGLDERLKTRFVQGLPLSIARPEKITCESILKMRIEAGNMSLDDFDPEVITYFASKFGSNVRELEGAFDRLVFYVINFKQEKHITLETAMESVQGLIDIKDDKNGVTVDKIIDTVAEYYGLPTSQITGKMRVEKVALARHIAMYLTRMSIADISLKKIGQKFGGRDHTTVINGIEKIETRLKTDKELQKAIKELKTRIDG